MTSFRTQDLLPFALPAGRDRLDDLIVLLLEIGIVRVDMPERALISVLADLAQVRGMEHADVLEVCPRRPRAKMNCRLLNWELTGLEPGRRRTCGHGTFSKLATDRGKLIFTLG